MELKVAESAPPHAAQFLKALFELKHLQEAHFDHLSKKHKTNTFQDSETVFIRAGITLLCSAWEAYVEDLACNGIIFLIENCKCPDELPLEIRKNIAKEIKLDKNELAPWALAGDDWRNVVKKRFESAVAKEANALNAPKSHKIRAIFADMLGIEDITKCWHWEIYDDAEHNCQIIDSLVEVRGNIAHGRAPNSPTQSLHILWYGAIVSQCGALMSNFVRDRLLFITGKDPWAMLRFNCDWTKFATDVKEYMASSLNLEAPGKSNL
jgi:RiboL-PSP-HEPN